MCGQQRLRSACAYAQSDQSHCLSLEYSLSAKLLTEHHLEFLSLAEGCRGSSESIRVKMPHCWKSHVMAHMRLIKNVLHILNKGVSLKINFKQFWVNKQGQKNNIDKQRKGKE